MDKAPGCKLATKWLVPSKDSGALGVPGCFQLLGGWVSGHISLGKWENTCCLCYYGLFICAPFFSGLGWLMPGPGGGQQAVICPCEEVALLLRGRSRGAQCAPQGSLPSASTPSRLTHIPPSQTSLPVGFWVTQPAHPPRPRSPYRHSLEPFSFHTVHVPMRTAQHGGGGVR